MEWTNAKIKNLRRRMGWSYADLARRLSCKKEEILALESGNMKASKEHIDQLEIILSQCEESTAAKQSQPQAESIMKTNGLGQITKSEIADIKS